MWKSDGEEKPFDQNADVQQKYVCIFLHVSHTPASTEQFHGREEAYSILNPGIT